MPTAICKKCGRRYYGWALMNPEKQVCPLCGGKLEVDERLSVVARA